MTGSRVEAVDSPTTTDNAESTVQPRPRVTGVYLVEPFRQNQAVIRWSGTLGVSRGKDLRTATMRAFAHFVAEQTQCGYIFADIQGTCYASLQCFIRALALLNQTLPMLGSDDSNNARRVILFDPMTHTITKSVSSRPADGISLT